MFYINFMIVLMLLVGLVFETWFVVRRNKKITLKGKDDFFTLALMILFAVLILPLNENVSVMESLRNVLVYVLLFSSVFVKRGISEKGIEKFGYTIDWNQIQEIYIEEYQMSKILLRIHAKGKQYRLQFSKYVLKNVLAELEKHIGNVYMKESLDDVLKIKK